MDLDKFCREVRCKGIPDCRNSATGPACVWHVGGFPAGDVTPDAHPNRKATHADVAARNLADHNRE